VGVLAGNGRFLLLVQSYRDNAATFPEPALPELHPIAWRRNIGEGNQAQPLRQSFLPRQRFPSPHHAQSGQAGPRLIPVDEGPIQEDILAYELPPLPYDYAALEPHIDTETMKLHHDKHHAAYVNNLNGAIEKHPELAKHTPEDLLRNLGTIPEDIRAVVRNNGGGHVNHTMFWTIMKPNGGGEPTGKIAEQIKKDFGSFADFKKLFNETTAKQFGSGWGWLVFEGGKLKVVTSPNQDNPISQGHFPILGNDVWEHAYYLKYQNKRPDYLAAWWNTVNWDEVNKRFEHAQK
jgi:superoxide dismutase, Fe-Mn family